MLELAMRLSEVANSESEWHRRMTSEKLNMSGKKIASELLQPGLHVYFYKPPSQQETFRLGRKAKHCQHYHGPAKVTRKLGHHSYEISYQGRTFQRDQGMLIPAKHRTNHGKNEVQKGPQLPPAKHSPDNKPEEGEYVLIKGYTDADGWYCAQIEEVLVDRIKVSYHTTSTPPLEDYEHVPKRARRAHLASATFSRTWIQRSDGLPTIIPPKTSRLHKDLWTGRIPANEIDEHLIIRNVAYSKGKLSTATIRLASKLQWPHHLGS
jgi:hypothetical protein